LSTGRVIQEVDKEKTFRLPELSEFLEDTFELENKRKIMEAAGEIKQENQPRIDRKNAEEYAKFLEMNPFADADESYFKQEYDIIPSIVGSGKLLGIPVPYLQTGHSILLLVCLLSSYVYAPGNPLTELPRELRESLRQSLLVVYSINTVLAIQAYFTAQSKNLPKIFWTVKTLLLGGIAYYEVTQQLDPTKLNDMKPTNMKKQRKL
jgi:hypothetical protein